MKRTVVLLLLMVGSTIPLYVHGQGEGNELKKYIRANYTKFEYKIPARDGVKLFTSVYVPKDTSRSYPIMLTRTPYDVAPYGVDRYGSRLGPSERFAKAGFIFVYQDVRGRFMSEGEFIEMTPHRPDKKSSTDVDESTDTWDSIDWLVRNIPNNNGNVGIWGISYPGYYAAAGMIDAHPALKAVSPQAPISDLFMGDDCYHNGAFFLAANFGFFTSFKERGHKPARPERGAGSFDFGTPDGYEFYLQLGPLENADKRYFKGRNPYWIDLLNHTTYDSFWQSRNILPHLNNVPPAVMTVGGWFDAEDLRGPLAVFKTVEERNPGISNHLVMGPWVHGGWSRGEGDHLGAVQFDVDTSTFYQDQIEFPFFDFHLNGKGHNSFPKAWVFETGTNRWRQFDSWPPDSAKGQELYLREGGQLTSESPSQSTAFDEYVSDPSKPVPFVGYTAQGMSREYMIADQRFAARRTDVLVYETEPLQGDVIAAGPISVSLWVSTTGTDADFVVKLIDVYPPDYPNPDPNPKDVKMGSYQQLVRGEPFRAKFRNSFEHPEPMVPGELAKIEFEMPDICHAFRPGHRIMVQIQSSWFPLVDRNPQRFLDIPTAKPEDFQKATQRISRSSSAPSRIALSIID
jgi:putative CocE/NonD family hydrolase